MMATIPLSRSNQMLPCCGAVKRNIYRVGFLGLLIYEYLQKNIRGFLYLIILWKIWILCVLFT